MFDSVFGPLVGFTRALGSTILGIWDYSPISLMGQALFLGPAAALQTTQRQGMGFVALGRSLYEEPVVAPVRGVGEAFGGSQWATSPGQAAGTAAFTIASFAVPAGAATRGTATAATASRSAAEAATLARSESVASRLAQIDAGIPNPPFTKGGQTFANRDGRLPASDGVTYSEWDVNPRVQGSPRDSMRLVTGSDGSAWFTNDHYETFVRIR